ncbi:MAG: GTP cyclohydrolase II [Chloroflexi bacterium]|nr:MAG: GTP cyclohydrolase II [Chloroflexota bacterium]
MNRITVNQMACARIPTEEGEFQLCLYRTNVDEKEHLALIMGEVTGERGVLTRVHSECFTGDVLGSLRCDCGPQLAQAMALIGAEERGVIIYLRQEGRGIGLLDKLRAYNLQDMGYDTVEANLMLGHEADARDYTLAALILQDLGVRSVRLMTNNPEKIEGLERFGMVVQERVPLQTAVTPENASYLQTKASRMRHLLQLHLDDTSLFVPVQLPPQMVPGQPRNGRPFVTLSYAQSLDGAITPYPGQPYPVSGPQSLRLTHQLRAAHDAIMVGIGTVLADDPRLTVRLVNGPNPQPVILDSQLRMPLTARLLQDPVCAPWILTTFQASEVCERALQERGAHVVRLPADVNGRVDLQAALHWLNEQGIRHVMVEGGAAVITSLLQARLTDRVVVTIAPVMMGGLNVVRQTISLNGYGFPRLHNVRHYRFADDLVLCGEMVWQ